VAQEVEESEARVIQKDVAQSSSSNKAHNLAANKKSQSDVESTKAKLQRRRKEMEKMDREIQDLQSSNNLRLSVLVCVLAVLIPILYVAIMT